MPDPLDDKKNKFHEFIFVPKVQKEKRSLWAKMFGQKKDTSTIDLTNRITALHPEVNSIHRELLSVLESFENNEALLPFAREVIDPMMRELDQIRLKLERNPSTDGLERYSQWTEKARLWVSLCNNLMDEEQIVGAITAHIVQRSLELIDRDMQLIEEYKNHQNSAIEINFYIEKLQELKVKPDVPLQKIPEWRAQLDIRRAALVNSALKMIDQG